MVSVVAPRARAQTYPSRPVRLIVGVQCSTLVTVPATTSSSQRPPRAVAACGDETAGGLGKMLMASQDVDQMVDVGAAMSGVQLDSKPR